MFFYLLPILSLIFLKYRVWYKWWDVSPTEKDAIEAEVLKQPWHWGGSSWLVELRLGIKGKIVRYLGFGHQNYLIDTSNLGGVILPVNWPQTDIGEWESILGRLREPWRRNSAKWPRNFGRRGFLSLSLSLSLSLIVNVI